MTKQSSRFLSIALALAIVSAPFLSLHAETFKTKKQTLRNAISTHVMDDGDGDGGTGTDPKPVDPPPPPPPPPTGNSMTTLLILNGLG